MEPTLAQTAPTVLANLGLAWTAGVLASRFWLMKRTAQWQDLAVRRLSAAMTAGLFACAVGILLSLWTEAAAMGDLPWLDAWPAFAEMLATTHYGHAGVSAVIILAAAMLFHWRLGHAGNEVRYVGAIAVLLLLVAAARAVVGHAFEHGPLSLAVWIEWLHLLSMSLWTGVVFVAGWAVLPQALAAGSIAGRGLADYLTSMSAWATVALAGVLATGVFNSYRVLDSARELIETGYGHVLLFKLCCVLIAVALGGFNKFLGLPAALSPEHQAMQARQGLRIVIAVLRIESVALFLVLAAAAVLINSAPPG